jgi:hypothetical protein
MMPNDITRRHVLAGAAATLAAAALPAAAGVETAPVGYSALDIEALDFPDTPAWARAVLSAYLNAGLEQRTFGEMFPHLLPLLEIDQ